MTIQAYFESPWKINGSHYEAPATLICEGVHAGSHGPIFWDANVLREAAHKWQNVPFVLGHPKIGNDFVSVTLSPDVFNKYSIGDVVDPYYDEEKRAIRATVRIPSNHPQKNRLMKLKEVSVGIFSEDTNVYGQWEGEDYQACALSMEPDHLALLLEGEQGACSWQDSCGVRVNSRAYADLQQTITTYTKGANQMTTEMLLPLGVHKKDETITEAELSSLQEEANQANILLPACFNVNLNKGDDNTDMLLPPGVE